MNIGAASKASGVSAKMIRYYESVGLVPAAGRKASGYRDYDAADVHRLAFIRRARDLGFSLEEVRELLSLAEDPGRPCADVDQLARAHLAQVAAKIAQLSALRAELSRVISECRGGFAVADCRILQVLSGPDGGEDVAKRGARGPLTPR